MGGGVYAVLHLADLFPFSELRLYRGLDYAKLIKNQKGIWIGAGDPPPIDVLTLRQVRFLVFLSCLPFRSRV